MAYGKTRALLPLVVLPVILTACLILWTAIGDATYFEARSDNALWDLTGVDFAQTSARVTGKVEYIAGALLTPDEFSARSGEVLLGDPSACDYATSRMSLIVPPGGYMLAGRSADYAERVYVNGRLAAEVGRPGATKEEAVPDTTDLYLAAEPVDGRIVIVKQVSNFVHREGGRHDDVRIGYPHVLRAAYNADSNIVVLGCFFALFLVHLALFFLQVSYRANLCFSLICLTWFFRTGVTGHKVLTLLMPGLNWYARFRIEYLAIPVTGILTLAMLDQLFPNTFARWFRRAVYALLAFFSALFLAADTYLMSWAVLPCYAVLAPAIAYIVVRLAMTLRKPSMEQWVCLAGLMVLFYGATRDMLFYEGFEQFFLVKGDLSRLSMQVFAFFQMTAVFMGTVRELDRARDAERRATAENLALERVSRMKADLLNTLSHETRTPLAVLSGYAELVALELSDLGAGEAAARDLNKIASEARRLSGLMERAEGIALDRPACLMDVSEVIRQVARLYEPILERRGTALILNLEDDLTVYGSPDEITQVLYNLLSNARKHTEGGDVRVEARREGERVRFCVSDTGCGISPEMLPRVFERGATDGGGSGLGLAICREIVKAHGGEIALESEVGMGTRVTVELPIKIENGELSIENGRTEYASADPADFAC